jgi:glycerol-3-phosphate acyltransferase PlsX
VAAHELLGKMPVNFVGNVEGQDILRGKADVIVCDGFVGNVVLKQAESMVGFLTRKLKSTVLSTTRGKMGALMMRPGLAKIRKELHYAEHGGAPLLGVNGQVIISHGKSNELAIKNAIRSACRFQEMHTAERTEELLGQAEG